MKRVNEILPYIYWSQIFWLLIGKTSAKIEPVPSTTILPFIRDTIYVSFFILLAKVQSDLEDL